MKDLIIPAVRLRRELRTLAICFAIAVVANIGAIIGYKTPFYEIFTQIGYVVVITLVLYLVWALIRTLVWLIRKASHKA
ncbi:MAG: hypothetical protein K5910_08660 [Bacteroidales bacterium]|nr:hypothetical protein [Bacteroidales bacterium]